MKIKTYDQFINEELTADFDKGLKLIKNIIPIGKDIKYVSNKIAEQFGYSRIKLIGNGQYGVAFNVIGENKVIKLTTDQNEVVIAEKLKNKLTKFIANYYDVREVKFDGFDNHNKIWAIVMDRVTPIQGEYFREYSGYMIVLHALLYDNDFNYLSWKINLDKVDSYVQRAEKYFKEFEKDSVFNPDVFREVILDIRNIFIELHKYLNLDNLDGIDTHVGNLGMKNGHLIMFDVSMLKKDSIHKNIRKPFTI